MQKGLTIATAGDTENTQRALLRMAELILRNPEAALASPAVHSVTQAHGVRVVILRPDAWTAVAETSASLSSTASQLAGLQEPLLSSADREGAPSASGPASPSSSLVSAWLSAGLDAGFSAGAAAVDFARPYAGYVADRVNRIPYVGGLAVSAVSAAASAVFAVLESIRVSLTSITTRVEEINRQVAAEEAEEAAVPTIGLDVHPTREDLSDLMKSANDIFQGLTEDFGKYLQIRFDNQRSVSATVARSILQMLKRLGREDSAELEQVEDYNASTQQVEALAKNLLRLNDKKRRELFTTLSQFAAAAEYGDMPAGLTKLSVKDFSLEAEEDSVEAMVQFSLSWISIILEAKDKLAGYAASIRADQILNATDIAELGISPGDTFKDLLGGSWGANISVDPETGSVGAGRASKGVSEEMQTRISSKLTGILKGMRRTPETEKILLCDDAYSLFRNLQGIEAGFSSPVTGVTPHRAEELMMKKSIDVELAATLCQDSLKFPCADFIVQRLNQKLEAVQQALYDQEREYWKVLCEYYTALLLHKNISLAGSEMSTETPSSTDAAALIATPLYLTGPYERILRMQTELKNLHQLANYLTRFLEGKFNEMRRDLVVQAEAKAAVIAAASVSAPASGESAGSAQAQTVWAPSSPAALSAAEATRTIIAAAIPAVASTEPAS